MEEVEAWSRLSICTVPQVLVVSVVPLPAAPGLRRERIRPRIPVLGFRGLEAARADGRSVRWSPGNGSPTGGQVLLVLLVLPGAGASIADDSGDGIAEATARARGREATTQFVGHRLCRHRLCRHRLCKHGLCGHRTEAHDAHPSRAGRRHQRHRCGRDHGARARAGGEKGSLRLGNLELSRHWIFLASFFTRPVPGASRNRRARRPVGLGSNCGAPSESGGASQRLEPRPLCPQSIFDLRFRGKPPIASRIRSRMLPTFARKPKLPMRHLSCHGRRAVSPPARYFPVIPRTRSGKAASGRGRGPGLESAATITNGAASLVRGPNG